MPADCGGMNTEISVCDEPTLIWFLWAFVEGTNPEVAGLRFGVHHDLPPGQGYVLDWDVCGTGPLVVTDPGAPDTPGGIDTVYGSPILERLFPFAWFAVYGNSPGDTFGTGIHQGAGEAWFVDDGTPPTEDPVHSFGHASWGKVGENECPPQPGSCCFDDGHCEFLMATECATLGGSYVEDNLPCDPNPCPPGEACCFPDGICALLIPDACLAAGGIASGPGGLCDPNPCPQPQACCFDDGACEWLLVEFCQEAGGELHGEGTVCDPNPCPELGACCDGCGECRFVLARDCNHYTKDSTVPHNKVTHSHRGIKVTWPRPIFSPSCHPRPEPFRTRPREIDYGSIGPLTPGLRHP